MKPQISAGIGLTIISLTYFILDQSLMVCFFLFTTIYLLLNPRLQKPLQIPYPDEKKLITVLDEEKFSEKTKEMLCVDQSICTEFIKLSNIDTETLLANYEDK